jgi:hypothetical protein
MPWTRIFEVMLPKLTVLEWVCTIATAAAGAALLRELLSLASR